MSILSLQSKGQQSRNKERVLRFWIQVYITVLKSGQVEVAVYRKATHTEKYLAFDSHLPGQSKAAVVKTLLDRAEAISSNANKRNSGKENVLKDLKINGYTSHFIDSAV